MSNETLNVYPPQIEIKPLSEANAVVHIPGSKSYTNRALIVASLADGISYLKGCLLSDDTKLMIQALQALGIPITVEGEDLTIMGRSGKICVPGKRFFAGNAGTTLRFLASLLTLGHGRYVLDGDERMRERPIGDLIQALNKLGVRAYSENRDGYPPIIIEADGLKGGRTTLSGENSSQFLSSLLMAAPYAQSPVEIEIKGDLVSKPYVDMTLSVIQKFGVEVHNANYSFFSVKTPQKYQPRYYTVEADASNASYFFAAAAVTKGKVRVQNLPYQSFQGDIHFVDLLEKMGCHVEKGTDWIELKGKELTGIEIDLKNMPDIAQTLAIVALFAKGQTVIKNIAHLKLKETDRITNLANELRKIGAHIEAGSDYLKISTGSLTPSLIETYNDHRMAMSFAVAGLKIPGITIKNPECVKKSFPNFWKVFEKLY